MCWRATEISGDEMGGQGIQRDFILSESMIVSFTNIVNVVLIGESTYNALPSGSDFLSRSKVI